jgi:hypothetical protein
LNVSAGGILKTAELVEKSACHDLSAGDLGGDVRRYVERIDDHATGGHGVADHHDRADADRRRNQCDEELEANAQAQAKAADIHLASLTA